MTLNQLNDLSTSRKDDLQALSMMMIYLLNKKMFPSLHVTKTIKSNAEKHKHFITAYKECNSIVRMCHAENCFMFTRFCQEVENLKYTTAPNYERLRKILRDLYSFEKNKEFGVYYQEYIT